LQSFSGQILLSAFSFHLSYYNTTVRRLTIYNYRFVPISGRKSRLHGLKFGAANTATLSGINLRPIRTR
jgi:hypothetical protein